MEHYLGRRLKSNEIVHHKDEDKRNNDINNLELITRSEHGKLHSTGKIFSEETKNKIRNGYKACGQNQGSSKLKDKQVILIKNLLKDGCGVRELGRLFQVSHTTISDIKNNKQWKHIL